MSSARPWFHLLPHGVGTNQVSVPTNRHDDAQYSEDCSPESPGRRRAVAWRARGDQQREVDPEVLADSNIALVIGHHAHVVQPMQAIDGKWIAYGHGNLAAAHREPEERKAEVC
ncbi:CapA family protein [Kribbella sp. WER1]